MVDSVVLTGDTPVDVLLMKLVEPELVMGVTFTVVWIVPFDVVKLFGTVEIVVTVGLRL